VLEGLLVWAEEGEHAAGGDQRPLPLGAAHRHGQAAGVEEEVAAGQEVLAVAFGGADEEAVRSPPWNRSTVSTAEQSRLPLSGSRVHNTRDVLRNAR